MVKNVKIFDAIEFKNIKEIIYNSAKLYKDKIAFVIKHKESKKAAYENITYSKFLKDINKLGSVFYKMNLIGKRIAIIGKNRYEWALSHISALLGGIVSVPLDKDLQYDELESSLIRSKADCIIFDEKLENNISKIKDSNKTNLSEFICMSQIEGYKSVPELLTQGNQLLDSGYEDYINAEIDENKMNILLFTSRNY